MSANLQKLVRRSLSSPKRLFNTTTALRNSDDKPKEWDLNKPEEKELYKFYRPERLTPNKRGVDLLKIPAYNKVIIWEWSVNVAFREWDFRFMNVNISESTDFCRQRSWPRSNRHIALWRSYDSNRMTWHATFNWTDYRFATLIVVIDTSGLGSKWKAILSCVAGEHQGADANRVHADGKINELKTTD